MSSDLVEYVEEDVPLTVEPTTAPKPKTAGDFRTEAVAHALEQFYRNASMLGEKITLEEAKALAEDFPDEAFSLGAGGDPDLVYIEHAYLRERLNKVLGVGSAVPIRRREWQEQFTYMEKPRGNQRSVQRTGIRIYVDLVLVVRGCLAGEAIGDSVYYPHNSKTNYSDALESAKSNAFRRCAKEFGVGLQAWQKAWVDGWKQRRRTTQRGPQPPAPQQKPAPVQNFSAPPEWPNTTVDDLKAWIDTLQSSAAFKFANGLLFGPDTPLMNMRERDPLIRHLHAGYHAKLDGRSPEVIAQLEPITREIDDTLAKHELDVEAHQAFS